MTASPNKNVDTSSAVAFSSSAPGGRQSFEGKTPRENLNRAHRYSAFVRQMKRILPLVALALALAVLAYALQPRDGEQISMTFERMGTIENDLAMINPRLTGADSRGLPYTVTAASAVQLGTNDARIRLEDVRAELTMENGHSIEVTAARGIIDNQDQTMEFFDGIRMVSAEGYSAETASARADLHQGLIYGTSPVSAQAAMGTLTANGFTFERDAGVLRFTGNVQMYVNGASE